MRLKRAIKGLLRGAGLQISRARPDSSDDSQQLALYDRLYPQASRRDRRLYNVGAGRFSHPYWTNIDYDSEWYARNREHMRTGIQYDLLSLQPIPVDSDSAEIVYTSHTIEHITDAAAENLFKEAHRMLKPGGVFRATTPNVELELQAYREDDRDYFYWIDRYSQHAEMARIGIRIAMREASTAQVLLHHFAASASELVVDGAADRVSDAQLAEWLAALPVEEALNRCTAICPVDLQRKYPGRHSNWWSFAKIERMLRAAGFTQIYLSGYGQSRRPVLRNTRLFDSTHPQISLYAETIK